MLPLPGGDSHTWEALEGGKGGGVEGGEGRGGESQQGTPHVRSVRFPLSEGLSPFYGRSESKVKRRRGSTRLPLLSLYTRSTFLSLPSSSVAALSPLEIRATTKAEVWTSPRACHDSLGFTEILLASLPPKASHPPTPPRTPKLEPPFLFFYASPNRAGNQSDLARLRPQQKINTSLHAYYSFTKSPRALESLLWGDRVSTALPHWWGQGSKVDWWTPRGQGRCLCNTRWINPWMCLM